MTELTPEQAAELTARLRQHIDVMRRRLDDDALRPGAVADLVHLNRMLISGGMTPRDSASFLASVFGETP